MVCHGGVRKQRTGISTWLSFPDPSSPHMLWQAHRRNRSIGQEYRRAPLDGALVGVVNTPSVKRLVQTECLYPDLTSNSVSTTHGRASTKVLLNAARLCHDMSIRPPPTALLRLCMLSHYNIKAIIFGNLLRNCFPLRDSLLNT